MGDDPIDDVADCEVTQSQCPKCKQWQDDFDGFGVLACVCGYCSHPSMTDGICGICEKRVDQPQGDKPGA